VSLDRAHEALVHEGRETVEDVCVEVAPVADLAGGLKAEASGEDAEAAEEPLLVRGQKVVAPRDRSP